ncbi:MAG: nuclear transport factor 2 family protein [Pseudomonadota bacterium]
MSQSAMAALLVLSACADVRDAPVSASAEADALAVEKFLATLDKTTLPADTLADLYLEDAVILRPGLPEVRGREAIVALMKEQAAGPALEMTHRADEITRFDDILVVQGGVTGVARPTDGSGPFPFATQNIILFKRDAQGEPKIWKVIFNAAPQEG